MSSMNHVNVSGVMSPALVPVTWYQATTTGVKSNHELRRRVARRAPGNRTPHSIPGPVAQAVQRDLDGRLDVVGFGESGIQLIIAQCGIEFP